MSLDAQTRHDEFVASHFLLLTIAAVGEPGERMEVKGDVRDGRQCIPSQIVPFEVRQFVRQRQAEFVGGKDRIRLRPLTPALFPEERE